MRDRTAASGGEETEVAIYDMADMPLSTGSVGPRPTPMRGGPEALESEGDRRVTTFYIVDDMEIITLCTVRVSRLQSTTLEIVCRVTGYRVAV